MPQRGDLIVGNEETLQSEILLQTGELGDLVVIEIQKVEIGETLEIGDALNALSDRVGGSDLSITTSHCPLAITKFAACRTIFARYSSEQFFSYLVLFTASNECGRLSTTSDIV